MLRSRAFIFAIKEFKELIAPTLFFAVSFNIIVLTTQLILDDYLIRLGSFLVATTAALVVGKAVLIANALPLLRRFDKGPLIQPIMLKTVVYFAVVFVVRFLEKIIEYGFSGGTLAGLPQYVTEHFTWHRFAAIQIWIFILFLIYVTATELNTLFGDGELPRLFLRWHSSEAKLTRRQRIRMLTRLNRLTEANPVEVISEKGSPAYTELIGILRELAARPGEKENSRVEQADP